MNERSRRQLKLVVRVIALVGGGATLGFCCLSPFISDSSGMGLIKGPIFGAAVGFILHLFLPRNGV